MIQEAENQSSYLALVGVKLGGSRLDRVDLETSFYKKTSICFSIVYLDLIVKIR